MKYSALGIFFLLLAVANESSFAQTPVLSPDSLGDGSGAIGSNFFQDFRSRLQTAVERRDFLAIQRLYQTNGVAEETLKVELGRWKQLLDKYTNVISGMFFKELATLPSPEAYRHWTECAHSLTDREVSHLCGVTFSPGNVVQLVLPLVAADGRLLIVPSDKEDVAYRIEQGGAANGSQPNRSETNRTSSSAGSRR